MKIFRGTPNLVKIEQKMLGTSHEDQSTVFGAGDINRHTDCPFEGTGCWISRGRGMNTIRTRQDVAFYVQCLSCYTEALMTALLIRSDTQVLSSD
jgi:hypothetical protein